MFGKSKPAASGYDGIEHDMPEPAARRHEQFMKGILDIGKMPSVIGKQKIFVFVGYGDLDGRGTYIDPEKIFIVSHEHIL